MGVARYDSQGGYYGTPLPGFVAPVEGTGAAGTPGITAEASAGPVVGSPRILSSPWSTSQAPGNFATVDVMAGDTSGMSSDAPVPASGDPLTGLSLSDVTETGAGRGSLHMPHPNSAARRP